MKSRTVLDFWRLFHNLPPEIQRKAYKAYRLWRVNPFARGLRFRWLFPIREALVGGAAAHPWSVRPPDLVWPRN